MKLVIIFVQLDLSFCQFSQLHSNFQPLALWKRNFHNGIQTRSAV